MIKSNYYFHNVSFRFFNGGIIISKKIFDIATTFEDGIIEGAPNRTLESAILIMGSKKFRRLPITKLAKIRGILTVTDILRAISERGLPEAYSEKISDWMTEKPMTLDINSSIIDAVKIMSENNFGSLLLTSIEEPDMLKAIVTERDILHHHKDFSWDNKKVKDIDKELITSGMIQINSKTSLYDAIKKMNENKIHRILTLNDEGKLNGILSANDITSLSSKERDEINENPNFLKSINAQFVGTQNLVSITLETQLKDAIDIMCEKNIGSLPILENGELRGLLTERSFLHLVAKSY